MASLAISLLAALLVGRTPSVQTPPATGATGADSLVGLWVARTTPPPAPRGELTLTRGASTWQATLGSARASFPRDGNRVRFSFSDDVGGSGAFRGTLQDGVIDGAWIQPPGGFGHLVGFPLVLKPAKGNAWRGTVAPLEETFTLYLKIFRDPEKGIISAFRNPERGEIGGTTLYRVVRKGDSETVEFNAGPDPANPVLRHVGTVLEVAGSHPDSLAQLPDHPGALPRDARAGRRLLPAPSRRAAVRLREASRARRRLVHGARPRRRHGRGRAREARAAPRHRRPGDPAAPAHPLDPGGAAGQARARGVLLRLRPRAAARHPLGGQEFGSVLLGAAMRRGAKVGPETPVYDAVAAMGPFANPDPRKARLTVAHLLTHTSGLACDDNDEKSPGNEETMSHQTAQPDWWKYTLDLPQAHEPGVRYAYCSANSNLVGAVLKTATKTSLPELFDRWVARPLDFGRYNWYLMPTGEGYLGGGAFLRSRDLLKVGQAYLDGGVWRGRRIVDASWVERSTKPYVKITPETTGLSEEAFGEFYGGGEDSWAWHPNRLKSGERTYREYAASGNGGQLLIVIPELEMVVVFTAGNYMQGFIWGRFRDQIVAQDVIPAIRR